MALILNIVLLSLFSISLILNLLMLKTIEKQTRRSERDRNLHASVVADLVDRVMHLSGSTWTPPPRPPVENDELDEETKLVLEGWREV